MPKTPASKPVRVDETTCAYLRGVSVYTQRRHRLSWQNEQVGKGPKPIMSPDGKPRYDLRDIEAEQNT
jgi:hypothetical protein